MNSSFFKRLFLIYLNSKPFNYDFLEISIFLGMTMDQFSVFLQEILDNGYIDYNEDALLAITEEGQHLLKKDNQDKMKFEDLFDEVTEIGIPEVTLDDIYVPRNFDEKII